MGRGKATTTAHCQEGRGSVPALWARSPRSDLLTLWIIDDRLENDRKLLKGIAASATSYIVAPMQGQMVPSAFNGGALLLRCRRSQNKTSRRKYTIPRWCWVTGEAAGETTHLMAVSPLFFILGAHQSICPLSARWLEEDLHLRRGSKE
mmetsp:Transcript_21810/g.46560  ORF Transcript_21810/g.46560 Transcript_21810/m.46560 type:complete len:149 (-) Transcript_21810:55-501(-)